MAEEIKATQPKGGKWFRKVPKEVLSGPGGMILILLAAVMEIIDWIPLPLLDQLWEIPLEIIFIVFLLIMLPWQSMVVPFVIERIPGISDILPTWLIRLFI